jgi:chitinase
MPASPQASTATYSLTDATPVISLASGTCSGAQTVTITCARPTATIYYTTNGKTPTQNSENNPIYTGAITVSSSETLKVLAAETGFTGSPIVSATYVINNATA